MSRFVDREFRLVDDADRAIYLRSLSIAVARTDWTVLSYALMSSHVHLGMLAGELPLSRFLHPLHTRFAIHWQHRHDGLGPVLADRAKNWEMRDGLASRMIAYHHRNPVEAGVVDSPMWSSWTSHRAYLKPEARPAWLDARRGLELCGFSDTRSGRAAFDVFVRELDLTDACLSSNDTEASAAPRDGAGEGVSTMLVELAHALRVTPVPVWRRGKVMPRERKEFVRQALASGATQADIGRFLGVSRSAISKILSRDV